MKKIYLSMMAMAIAAFTFTSCEDVPEPYNNPYDQIKPSEPEVVIEPAGEGTKESPWNVAAVIEACSSLNDGDFLNDGAEVFVTGIVTETTDISTSYGNATYYISDNAKASNKFYVYRGKLLDGAAVAADTDLEVGDSVTVCGKIKNYKGTMEFDQGNYLVYYKKGEGGGDTPTPDAPGTAEKPLTVAEALAYIDANLEADKQSPVGYVKGIIVSVTEISTSYGNATYIISDDGTDATTLQVYRGLGLGGEKFTSEDALKAGDVVIVTGKLVNYKGNTKQFAQGSQLVQLNDKKAEGGGDTPSGEGEGNGTADSPYNVTAAIAAGSGTGVYVKAFIVGSVDGQVLATGATFSATSNTQTNILIAASADETDVNKCMPVQLPAGAIRTGLNLKDNAGNYKKEVTLYGNIEKYFGATGIKAVSFAILNGTEIGTNPAGGSGGGDTPSGDVKTVTIADFNAAAESTDVWYKLTGTISNLKEGDLYGNFDLTDGTGTVYVYGLLAEKGGEKKKFQELVEKYGLANGSTITIIGNRGSYNGKIEVMNAYIVIDGNGGGDTPGGETGADGSTIISVADFNAAAESTDVWYQLTGTIKNLKDGDLYGNFDLEDSTGSVYVYGVLSEKGGAKKKFQELVAEKGIANGKKITIVGNRGSYNGKIEVMNAYFIKVE